MFNNSVYLHYPKSRHEVAGVGTDYYFFTKRTLFIAFPLRLSPLWYDAMRTNGQAYTWWCMLYLGQEPPKYESGTTIREAWLRYFSFLL